MVDYSQRLRELVEADEVAVSPGVHDPLTARVIEDIGFGVMSMTGNGTSVAKLGLPDAGLITMPEMVENAQRIQETVDVPIFADADTGYGNAVNVVRTVREFIKAGVAGIHLEDQVFPKRCGHLAGKEVLPKSEAVGKIRAAADVRDERKQSFVIIARTDVRGTANGSVMDAIARANAYCDAGADVAFIQGPTSRAEVERIGAEVDAPLLYNVSGDTPKLDPSTLGELGFDLVMFPRLSTLATVLAVRDAASELADDPVAALDALQSGFAELPYDGFNDFAGFDEVAAWESAYLPNSE